MNLLSDALMEVVCALQKTSFAYAEKSIHVSNFKAYGCRNACSGSCEGSCYGSCQYSCDGGCMGSWGYD